MKVLGLTVAIAFVKKTFARPVNMNDASFVCTQCGWCCKNSDRHTVSMELWKKSLTANQIGQVQTEQANYQQEPNWCPALIFEDGKYWCLPHKLFGEEAKPQTCQDFPYGNPEKLCYPYFKDEIDWKKTKMTPDHLHLEVTSMGGDKKMLKFI